MSQKKLESAKNVLFIALGIDMVVTALVIIADVWAIGVLNDIRSGASTLDQSTLGTIEFWDSFAKIMILTVIGVGIALVRWLGACYEYAKETLKVTGFSQETWKALGWIIPIMNIFKPYQVLSEIYKVGAPDYVGGDAWKRASGSGLLIIWWIFWIITHMILWGIAKQNLRSSFRDDLTLNQIISMSYGGIAICVISLIVAGLWFVVAGSLTRRLLGRSAPVVTMAAPSNTELSADIEDQIYAQIADELDSRNLDKATWTKVYAASDGEDKKARSAYIKLRFEKLMSGWEEAQPKVEAELPRQEPLSTQILVDDQPMEGVAKAVIGIGILVVVLIIFIAASQPSKNQATGSASGSKKASAANQPIAAMQEPIAPALPMQATPPPNPMTQGRAKPLDLNKIAAGDFSEIHANNRTRKSDDKSSSWSNSVKDGQYVGSVGPSTINADVMTNAGKREIKITAQGEFCSGYVKVALTQSGNTLSGSPGERCTISVEPVGQKLKITENQCEYFHGAECDFNGTLRKISDSPMPM